MATDTATAPLVARRPIYDPALRVVAYELLVQDDGEATTSAISELGLNLVMGRLAYIPVSPTFLLEGFARTLAADRVVLKVPPDAALDGAAVAALEELVAAGYTLALERFEPAGPLRPLLPLAKVVGLDVRALDRGPLRQLAGALKRAGAILMAENVEDHDELELCQQSGFDLLHGYFFCRPRVVNGRPVEVNRVNGVRLAGALHADDVDLEAVQAIISCDVALSYNLLRFINSAFFSLPRRVDSIRDALVLLGVVNVRKWATLMAIADTGDKPRELVVTGLVRARMCELIAESYGYDDGEGFFTTGLFSVVDALTDSSMVELLASLPLSEEIVSALLNHAGAKGRILRAVVAYERGNFTELSELTPVGTALSELYAEAVAWSSEACGVLAEGGPPTS